MTDSLSQGDDRIVQGPGDSGLQATTRAVTDAELTPREALELELVSDGDLDASLAEVMPIRSLRADAWRRFKRNRLAVAFNWMWEYVTFGRRARLITRPPPAAS